MLKQRQVLRVLNEFRIIPVCKDGGLHPADGAVKLADKCLPFVKEGSAALQIRSLNNRSRRNMMLQHLVDVRGHDLEGLKRGQCAYESFVDWLRFLGAERFRECLVVPGVLRGGAKLKEAGILLGIEQLQTASLVVACLVFQKLPVERLRKFTPQWVPSPGARARPNPEQNRFGRLAYQIVQETERA